VLNDDKLPSKGSTRQADKAIMAMRDDMSDESTLATRVSEPRDPVADLRRIAFLLERAHEATYRVRAFRTAASVLAGRDDLAQRARAGTLTALSGVGEVIARCVTESLAGEQPAYLRRLEAAEPSPMTPEVATQAGAALRAALRGDCHSHSDWSDGGSPIQEMAAVARELGHDYLALTDHSPRLTVARGLSAERLRQQLDVVAELNTDLAPFRILTGIEVDILDDGTLDQSNELLAELDIVVASVHSQLRMPAEQMTRRMLAAVTNPHVDVLGHCTGRLITGTRRRPESQFDADVVFTACARHGVAVEINSRPERLDPPKRLLRRAVEAGCLLSVDSDAHAPGQLDWQRYGCERAAACGAPVEQIVNTWPVDELLSWTARHAVAQ
jgi:putative hydrolase